MNSTAGYRCSYFRCVWSKTSVFQLVLGLIYESGNFYHKDLSVYINRLANIRYLINNPVLIWMFYGWFLLTITPRYIFDNDNSELYSYNFNINFAKTPRGLTSELFHRKSLALSSHYPHSRPAASEVFRGSSAFFV